MGATRVRGVGVVALPVLASPGATGEHPPLLGPGAAEAAADLGLDLAEMLSDLGASGVCGELTPVPIINPPATNPALTAVFLVGVGAASGAEVRRAAGELGRRTAGQDLATTIHLCCDAGVRAVVDGLVLGSFAFSLRADRRVGPASRVVLAGTAQPDWDASAELSRALVSAGASWQARLLATVPSATKTPAWLVGEAVRTATASGLSVTVWDQARLAKDGFGGILAVGSAGVTPPGLVRLDYRPPRSRRRPHVVLVGKGITFDSGGLNIKPGQGMTQMKRDMTGAGVVLATMNALADVGCPVRVTGLLAVADNAIDRAAMRPGDVIRHYGGRTSEVTNTDAEGRLVLADSLAYAVDKLDPDVLVDVATLTGAVKVALGRRIGGLFSTDETLAESLIAAGETAGEPLWRMPLSREYAGRLHSAVADAISAPPAAQAIVAALFLEAFTGGRPWAHLDIASVGDGVEDEGEWTKGPTGFGTRLLLEWLAGPDPTGGVG